MEGTRWTQWPVLLRAGGTPRWVPPVVGRAIAGAHAAGGPACAVPAGIRIDQAERRVELPEPTDGAGARSLAADLAATCADLLSLALQHPDVARHVFQQTALLWRAYREARELPVRGEFEAELVQAVAAQLYARHPEPWLMRLVRDAERGRIDTLHVWIDALNEAGVRGRG